MSGERRIWTFLSHWNTIYVIAGFTLFIFIFIFVLEYLFQGRRIDWWKPKGGTARCSETKVCALLSLKVKFLFLFFLVCVCVCVCVVVVSDKASRGARGAPAPPTAAGPVEYLVLSF